MQQTTTDPRGVASMSDFDMLGQTVTTIAGFTTGVPSNSADQTTAYTHDGDGNQATMTAVMPAGTPSQTTAWIYGVTTSAGSTDNSNDVIGKVEYPDRTTGVASTACLGPFAGLVKPALAGRDGLGAAKPLREPSKR